MKKLLLLGLMGLGLGNLHAADFRDFTKTCKKISLEKASIFAECKAENGATYITALRLRGVNVVDGELTADENSATLSKFHTVCKQTAIDARGILAGSCLNKDKEYVWTSLDLKPMINNYNGTLVYPLPQH